MTRNEKWSIISLKLKILSKVKNELGVTALGTDPASITSSFYLQASYQSQYCIKFCQIIPCYCKTQTGHAKIKSHFWKRSFLKNDHIIQEQVPSEFLINPWRLFTGFFHRLTVVQNAVIFMHYNKMGNLQLISNGLVIVLEIRWYGVRWIISLWTGTIKPMS